MSTQRLLRVATSTCLATFEWSEEGLGTEISRPLNARFRGKRVNPLGFGFGLEMEEKEGPWV